MEFSESEGHINHASNQFEDFYLSN